MTEKMDLPIKSMLLEANGNITYQMNSTMQQVRKVKNKSRQLGILPIGVRWVNDDFSQYIIERPPFQATVAYEHAQRAAIAGNKDENKRFFSIWIPWQVYIVTNIFSSCSGVLHYQFRSKSITTLEELQTPSIRMPLPNIGSNYLCVHTEDYYSDWSSNMSLTHSDMMINIICSYWNQGFNDNITTNNVYNPLSNSWQKSLELLESYSLDDMYTKLTSVDNTYFYSDYIVPMMNVNVRTHYDNTYKAWQQGSLHG